MDSNTEAWLKPITLMGNHISLVPFSLDNRDDFMEATKDGELWKLWYATVPSPENIMDEINRRLNSQDKGTLLPWAIIDNNTGRAIGMTTYLNISQVDKRLDIGWTWYCNSCIQTLTNVECKLLLLTYAFETLKCLTVRFGVNFLILITVTPLRGWVQKLVILQEIAMLRLTVQFVTSVNIALLIVNGLQ